jgi:hypothetical protein
MIDLIALILVWIVGVFVVVTIVGSVIFFVALVISMHWSVYKEMKRTGETYHEVTNSSPFRI